MAFWREIGMLGCVLSEMAVPELAASAAWINAAHPVRPLTVAVGQVRGFADIACGHALLESGELPRMADGTVGRLVLRP